MICVVGHLNPDTDTIVSAMALAEFFNKKYNNQEYQAYRSGEPNSETDFVFRRFNAELPELLEDASGKKVFLVDHNEAHQRVKGVADDNVLGFVDHHKIKFECPGPIFVQCRPWGSTNSIIYQMFKKNNIQPGDTLKKLMLAAILSDTVILKSPTTTDIDRQNVEELSKELNVDYKSLGMEMFKAKAQIASKTPQQILNNDFKVFDMNGKKVGIGQVETPDITEVEPRYKELLAEMEKTKSSEAYHSVILMVTDIMKEGSRLLIAGDQPDMVAGIFETQLKDSITEFIPGMMSRKKQVARVLADKLC